MFRRVREVLSKLIEKGQQNTNQLTFTDIENEIMSNYDKLVNDVIDYLESNGIKVQDSLSND